MLKGDLTVSLVERLVASQFPHWAGLPVVPVDDGRDNATFRLGDAMAVRLPSADPYVAQVDKEHRWLPVLAPHLPVAIPVPLAKGAPSAAFPTAWSVYRWIDGHAPTGDNLADLGTLATELAGFLTALYRFEPDGPTPGDHSFSRGGPVGIWDAQVRELLARLDGTIDAAAAVAVWESALDASHDGPDVWVHGDVTGSNLVVRDGHLVGVIEFGCSAVGDPACDLTVAWTMFTGESRRRFQAEVHVEPSAWVRARGWALWRALIHLGGDAARPGRGQRRDRRAGWRIRAADVVDELAKDVAGHSRRPPRHTSAVTAPAPTEDGSPRLVLREARPVGDIRRFTGQYLGGVLELCEAEGWPSLPEDPARATRVLTAPGVTTVVALDGGEVVGFAQMLSDGEIQAFLASLVVARSHRGRGLGHALVDEALGEAGGTRIDLLSEDGAVAFYESFPHLRKPGFRLYPFYR